ncbi:hypothetical protein WA026_003754 [Henosepilachna vigintioctopunctata]|uniref:Immunoglobulin V-set domain-containing protein n=1 Tax=Henosepilachna vigintioctopunctata TaxID=420089 RepID=A0AAW1UEC4_9CUCU
MFDTTIAKKILLLILVISIRGSYSIKFKKLLVPELVKSGDNVTLICDYDMEKDPLYSVKWHYGMYEFYRFVPSYKPGKMYFPLKNVKVDVSNSGPNKVVLLT